MVLQETKNHIKNQVVLAVGIEKGSLIDFETTGLLKDKEHEIVCFGYVTSNKLVIIGRKTSDKRPFYEEITKIIKELPKPFYAYNANFEHEIMKHELGIQLKPSEVIDLQKPWKEKADQSGLKWPKLDELISEPENYFGEAVIHGKDCPGLWKGYISTGNENLLKMIMQHNLSDLLREFILLLLHPELYKR